MDRYRAPGRSGRRLEVGEVAEGVAPPQVEGGPQRGRIVGRDETVEPFGVELVAVGQTEPVAAAVPLQPIAEGVSHADQAEFLAQHDCYEMQGFYFSAALPAQAFREKLETE